MKKNIAIVVLSLLLAVSGFYNVIGAMAAVGIECSYRRAVHITDDDWFQEKCVPTPYCQKTPFKRWVYRLGRPDSHIAPCPDDSLGERSLRKPSAELLGQCDDDALGAADVTEPTGAIGIPSQSPGDCSILSTKSQIWRPTVLVGDVLAVATARSSARTEGETEE